MAKNGRLTRWVGSVNCDCNVRTVIVVSEYAMIFVWSSIVPAKEIPRMFMAMGILTSYESTAMSELCLSCIHCLIPHGYPIYFPRRIFTPIIIFCAKYTIINFYFLSPLIYNRSIRPSVICYYWVVCIAKRDWEITVAIGPDVAQII